MKKLLSTTIIIASTLILSACGSDNDNNSNKIELTGKHAAIIQVSEYGSTSSLQIVDLNDDDRYVTAGLATQSDSDYTVSSYKNFFYHIGRHGNDTITKYDISDALAPINSFSTLETPESDTSNIYTVVQADDDKAYLVGYNLNTIWIVNPNATGQDEFKLGEIDLSAYADNDGKIEAVDGIIVDDKLYIMMARLDRGDNSSPVDPNFPAMVAVIDTTTDSEIDTNLNDDPSELKGIELTTRNPEKFAYHEDTGLLLQATGDPYGPAYYARPLVYVGGITRINDDYSIEFVVDDGPDDGNVGEHPYDYITNFTIVDGDTGYFLAYAGWKNTRLFRFNPSTGEVYGPVDAFTSDSETFDIRALGTDPMGDTWVGVADDAVPSVKVIDETGAVIESYNLIQNPIAITFTTIEP